MTQSNAQGQPGHPPDSIAYYRKQMQSHHQLRVSAHRGSSDLAPENTLATYRRALAMQVDYIEIDVRTTNDGKLVILHDGTVNRTTNGTGPVRNLALADVKKLSAGKGFTDAFANEPIPALEEVCQLLADWNASHPVATNLYVDCKDVAPEPLVATLMHYGLLTNAVFYGSDTYLAALQKVAPSAKLMPALQKADDIASKISALHPYAFDVNYSALNESLIQQIHQQGIRVFSDLLDTLDQPVHYKQGARMGVDVIQTDHVMSVYRALSTPN